MSPNTITINRRLRPIRLAFLTRPDDKKTLLQAIRINTCLWGGKHNAIIPLFGKTPSWWDSHKTKQPAKEILYGYIEAFEPDYFVTIDGKAPKNLEIDETRLIKLNDLSSSLKTGDAHFGINVINVYRHLYRQEYQFVRRHPTQVLLPLASNKADSLFLAACFGDFPKEKGLEYFLRGYKKAFDPSDTIIKSDNIFGILTNEATNPLSMGSAMLNIRPLAWAMGPTLYYLDINNPSDIIDFWNLRAMGWEIYPIPHQWAAPLTATCKRFIADNHKRTLKHNPEIHLHTTVLQSRHVRKDDALKFCTDIRVAEAKTPSTSLQTWYPRIWDEWAREKDHVQRCEISAQESDTECPIKDGRIQFKTLSPKFAKKTYTAHPQWANAIQIKDYWSGSETANVIPPGMRQIVDFLGSHGRNGIFATSEGLVVTCQHTDWTCYWELPQGVALLKSWFSEKGFNFELSDKGRIALAVLRSLDGLTGASLLANTEVIKLLNNMAHGEIDAPEKEGETLKQRVARARFIQKDKWIGLLKQIYKDNTARVHWHWKMLVDKGVLRLGIHLKCPQCAQTTWYPLGKISEEIRCGSCAANFPFPKSDPPKDGWSYRTQGPFTVENYAQGSYAVLLALRFLSVTLHSDTTWAPSLEDSGNRLEIDFSLWWKTHSFSPSTPTLILGECKTFNTFKPRDISRARKLSRRFPGAILAFATLRDSLNTQEKKLLSKLSRAGRKHLKAGKTHSPVLILTARELTDTMGPPHCWKDAGGRIAQIGATYRGFGNITELCDITQQIYLDMESYGEWLRKEIDRLTQQLKKPPNQQSSDI